MMSTTLLATIFVFGLLVFVHEFGHFAVAKLVRMRVDEFAIGFGPKLFSRKYGETLYSLRIIPLGGFNKIAGMDPEEEQDEYSFNAKPIWARMLVIIAGSFMNFILPVVLFTIVFMSAGIDTPIDQPVIGSVMAGKPASLAGLMPGDRVLKVNDTQIETWGQFVTAIRPQASKNVNITYMRNNTVQQLAITPEYDANNNRGIIGVTPQIENRRLGLIEAITLSFKQTIAIIISMVVAIYHMITGQTAAEVAGPIGVAQMAGQVAQLGIIPLLQFAATLSLNLGIINLLPIPALDGGHVVTLAAEGVRGKPLNKEKQQFIQMIGFIMLLLLLAMATFKDISRIKLF